MKTWEIYHYTYGDVCSDSWYGKTSKYDVIGCVTESEENVKTLVEKLNTHNHSFWSKEEPEDEYDNDFLDEDYYGYTEFKATTIDEIESRYLR